MHISFTAEHILKIGSFTVTNSMFASALVFLILTVLAFFATRKMEKIPRGIQNLFEAALDGLLKLMDSVTGDRQFSIKIFPMIATFFIFILFNNWFGLLPGVGTIGIKEIHDGKEAFVPILRAGTADLNTTIALGVIAVLSIQVVGIASIGFFKYSKKFINFSSPIHFFVGILEIISEMVKIVSFAFRLFGNIFAGEVLLTVLSVLAPFVIPLPFYFMEIFVGFVQALVFTMLVLVFYKMAAISHESH